MMSDLMILEFTKMNGAGNDFVLMDNRSGDLDLGQAEIARICDRHRGVGADGLLLVEPAEKGADVRMRYYNSDGGEAEMCGNGARCFSKFAGHLVKANSKLRFETIAGIIESEQLEDGQVRLQMSDPVGLSEPVMLEIDGEPTEVHFVNTGVPHAVIFVDSIDGIDPVSSGRAVRRHEHFQPDGTNANFVEISGQDRIAIRTYERGVEAETLACGTGVVACALISHLRRGVAKPVTVRVRGGDDLGVDWTPGENGPTKVLLTGPADLVFTGTIQI